MSNLLALWFLGCGLGMCRACAARVAVRQPQQCYRAGTSLLYYKASSVSSFPPENGRVKHKSLANTYRANYPYSPSRLVVPSSRRQPLYAAPVPRRLLAAGERLPLPGVFAALPFVGDPSAGGVGHRRPSRSSGATSAGTRTSFSTARKLTCGTRGWGRSSRMLSNTGATYASWRG